MSYVFLSKFAVLSDAADVILDRMIVHKHVFLMFWTKVSHMIMRVKQEKPTNNKQNLLKKKKFVKKREKTDANADYFVTKTW